jgi:hypothetical protein
MPPRPISRSSVYLPAITLCPPFRLDDTQLSTLGAHGR